MTRTKQKNEWKNSRKKRAKVTSTLAKCRQKQLSSTTTTCSKKGREKRSQMKQTELHEIHVVLLRIYKWNSCVLTTVHSSWAGSPWWWCFEQQSLSRRTITWVQIVELFHELRAPLLEEIKTCCQFQQSRRRHRRPLSYPGRIVRNGRIDGRKLIQRKT